MPHVRTQIRERFSTLIAAALPTHTVFSSRRSSINASELPIIDLRFLNENSERRVMDSTLFRTASLYVRIARAGDEDDLDSLLDADTVAIETAVAGTDFTDLLIDGELLQSNFTDSGEGASAVAEIVLRYDLTYRTSDDDPETPEV